MYNFEVLSKDELKEAEYYKFNNKSIFTTFPWLDYLEKDTGNKATVIRIKEDEKLIGFLTGIIIKKFGIRIFASPFKGWATCYMGFDLIDYSQASSIIPEISDFIIKKLKCLFIEIVDKNIDINTINDLNLKVIPVKTLELDIDKNDEDLLHSFKKDCRNFIRQFEKRGAYIKEAKPDKRFIEEYYNHLKDVFSKQKLVPTYNERKVKNLLNSLRNTDYLLCLEVFNPEGISIACSITFAFNKYCYTWGTASDRKYQSYRPNEYLRWYAARYWRDCGYKKMDMVGVRQYKYKFNPVETQYPRIMISKYKILFSLRDLAQKFNSLLFKIRGIFKK